MSVERQPHAGKSKKRKRKTTETELTLDAMETYVKFKSFDVIGNGTYRRYVNMCKEKGEDWAVKMTHGETAQLQRDEKKTETDYC